MSVKLVRIGINEAETLWKMQVEAFRGLYEKYKDTETSPAAESIDKVTARLKQHFTYYYFIQDENVTVGAIRVVDEKEKGNCYLYEKMGYHQTGKTTVINENLTLVFYEKRIA